MSDQNNISDLQVKNPGVNTSVVPLPIRGEKRIIPSPISGKDTSGFNIEAAVGTVVDYVTIRILNRGLTTSGEADSTQPLVYRFLINPKTVNISHSTLDSQTLTRGGWQFGLWGEDLVRISMNGSTAGQYFSGGVTDQYAEYSKSYRNLAQLQIVFENNGYWFEGEELGEGPLAASATRRRIKMHNDVELTVGDFIWYGCFDSLQVSQDAENPFLARFSIEFTAWKERFRKTSPYWNNIENNVQRGHSYSVYGRLAAAAAEAAKLSNTDNLPLTPRTPSVSLVPVPPAVASEQSSTSNTSLTSGTSTSAAPAAILSGSVGV